LINCGINIDLGLIKISFERANKHLSRREVSRLLHAGLDGNGAHALLQSYFRVG
jgi:hypothetical protein